MYKHVAGGHAVFHLKYKSEHYYSKAIHTVKKCTKRELLSIIPSGLISVAHCPSFTITFDEACLNLLWWSDIIPSWSGALRSAMQLFTDASGSKGLVQSLHDSSQGSPLNKQSRI